MQNMHQAKAAKVKTNLHRAMTWLSNKGHVLILARRRANEELHKEVPLLRLFTAFLAIFVVASLALLAFSGLPKIGEFLVELVSLAFAAIGVFEISDGVVLTERDRLLLTDAAKGTRRREAFSRIPLLLVEASEKCKVGLVFVLFGWILDWLLRFHLIEQSLEFLPSLLK